MRNDGGAAFPREYHYDDFPVSEPGMTLRDYFAAQALTGLIAKHPPLAPTTDDGPEYQTPALAARGAYIYADAMLAERERSNG